MQNKNQKNIPALPHDAAMLRHILDIPLPPPNDIAPLLGFGFSEDSEIDYEAIAPSHPYELPDPNQLYPSNNGPPMAYPLPQPTISTVPTSLTTAAPIAAVTHTNHGSGHTIATPPETPIMQSAAVKGHHKSKFSARELEELVRVVYKVNPYGAKHGEEGNKWMLLD